MGIRQFFKNAAGMGGDPSAQGGTPNGSGAPPNGAPNGGNAMAPSFFQQMADSGNQALAQQGMQPYVPLQSQYFSNDFNTQHPAMSGALGGALGFLSHMGPTPEVSGFGDGLARMAQGFAGNLQGQRQFHQQQAMMPMQIAQGMAEYRKSLAPEAIKTDAGIALRNPITGSITPGMGMAQIAAGNNGAFDTGNADYSKNLLSRVPDANEREQNQIRSSAQSLAQIWDPQKRGEQETAMFKDIADRRQKESEFQQTAAATASQRVQTNVIARDNADSKRMLAVASGGKLALAQFQTANTLYQPAKDADVRLATMKDAALHPNPQNDVALLYNHIAMTLSASGATPSQAEIFHAIETRSLPQSALASLQKVGIGMDTLARVTGQDPKNLPPGGFLTPDQRAQMVNLGSEVRKYQWHNADRSANYQKVAQWRPSDMPELDPIPQGNSFGAATTTVTGNNSQRVDGGGRGVNNPNPMFPPSMGANSPYAGFKRN